MVDSQNLNQVPEVQAALPAAPVPSPPVRPSWFPLLVIGTVVWLLFFNGTDVINRVITAPPANVVYATTTAGAIGIPTAAIMMTALPADGGVHITPVFATTIPTLQPLPTEIPPAVLAQGALSYALITNSPTPFPTPACTKATSAYVTDPVKVLNAHGVPIGEVQGWSCSSQEEAIQSVNQQAMDMITLYKAHHP